MLIPVVMGAIFALLFYPVHTKIKATIKLRDWTSAGLVTFAALCLVFLPTTYLILRVAETGIQQVSELRAQKTVVVQTQDKTDPKIKLKVSPSLKPREKKDSRQSSSFIEELANAPAVKNGLSMISEVYPIKIEELIQSLRDWTAKLAYALANFFTYILASLPAAALNLVVLVVSLFFFLVDGERLVGFLKQNSFFSAQQTKQLLRYSGLMCRSVLLALFVSGVFQSATFSIACWSLGLSNVILIFASVLLMSFVPLVGSSPVTGGIALYQLIIGNTGIGVFLLIMAVFVAFMDNLIRPVVIRGAGDLHPLLTFISAFGGIQVFGITGVFLGPIVAGIFVVTLNILTQNSKALRSKLS